MDGLMHDNIQMPELILLCQDMTKECKPCQIWSWSLSHETDCGPYVA